MPDPFDALLELLMLPIKCKRTLSDEANLELLRLTVSLVERVGPTKALEVVRNAQAESSQ